MPESMKERLYTLLEFNGSLSGESSLCLTSSQSQILHNATQRAAAENTEAKRGIFTSQCSIRRGGDRGRTRSRCSFTYGEEEEEEEVAAQFLQEDTLLDLRTR